MFGLEGSQKVPRRFLESSWLRARCGRPERVEERREDGQVLNEGGEVVLRLVDVEQQGVEMLEDHAHVRREHVHVVEDEGQVRLDLVEPLQHLVEVRLDELEDA